MMKTARFGLEAGNRLAHALAARVAQESGIRVLSIKGQPATDLGLRPPRPSADADVLVEPGRFAEYCRLLEERGWHPRVRNSFPRLIELHSLTVIHDGWPCDIDLHSSFPGFFASAEEVFETLWRARRVHHIAHQEIIIPSLAGMAAIVALHAERTPYAERSVQDRMAVVRALNEEFSCSDRSEFQSILKCGRAQWVLRNVTAAAGLSAMRNDASPVEMDSWEQNQKPLLTKSATAWWRHLRSAPPLNRAQIIVTTIWVPRRDIPRNNVNQLPSRREAWQYQIGRWRRGLEALRQLLNGAHRI